MLTATSSVNGPLDFDPARTISGEKSAIATTEASSRREILFIARMLERRPLQEKSNHAAYSTLNQGTFWMHERKGKRRAGKVFQKLVLAKARFSITFTSNELSGAGK